MKYLVRFRQEDGSWSPDVEAEAKEKWDALVKVVVSLGLEKKYTMSEAWRSASIRKKDKPAIRRWRKKED